MPSLKKTVLAAAALLPMLGTAHAGDPDGRYAVKGIGLLPCGAFLQSAEQGSQEAPLVMTWLSGYLSAANMFMDGAYDLVSWQDDQVLANALAATCNQMPQQPVAVAATQLIRGLGGERVTKAEQMRPIKVAGQETAMYPTVIRRLQQRLKDSGQAITVDGDFGPGSQKALAAYQTQMGLPATGFPDTRTMIAVFAGQVPPAGPGQRQAQAPGRPAAQAPMPKIDMEPVSSPFGKKGG
ncbi:peptidoglycan-binding domain-containing protein [Parvularcula maris]|uniref:Peptidoglycan-binding protein n=1 Tax=Parvularcula maris TaxID=2965077 RepID=A0A9X2L8Z3_9PROT|nr:peptidoglycan-binding domain-containing protein [Parvularcula maris]MCQ8185315.1 peptidoglycan-binding protein [Parvularcula maris]